MERAEAEAIYDAGREAVVAALLSLAAPGRGVAGGLSGQAPAFAVSVPLQMALATLANGRTRQWWVAVHT